MNREELSELVVGKLLEGSIGVASVNEQDLCPPYDEMARIIKEAPDTNKGVREKIVQQVGYLPLDVATTAAKHVNGMPIDWALLLHEAAVKENVADNLERHVISLRRNEETSASDIISVAHRLHTNKFTVQTADMVKPEIAPFVKSNWLVLDTLTGGFPKSGLTVVGASPGTGKTTLMIRIAIENAKSRKNSMLFSLEMTAEQLLNRITSMEPNLTKEELARIYICDEILTPNEIPTVVSTLPVAEDLGFIGVDFAELLLASNRDQTEAAMASVYQSMVYTAKLLRTPVLLLSQLNRSHDGGIPKISNLRYTGMAEALASMILLLYNPKATRGGSDSSGVLPPPKLGHAYIILGKSRFGHLWNQKTNGTLAVSIPWDGKKGWSKTIISDKDIYAL